MAKTAKPWGLRGWMLGGMVPRGPVQECCVVRGGSGRVRVT